MNSIQVINAYLRKLIYLQCSIHSVWKDSALPYGKEEIRAAIFEQLRLADGEVVTAESTEKRRALVFGYIRLADFIAPDDAQLLIQSEKLVNEMAELRARGGRPTTRHDHLLRQYERPAMRLRAKIDRDRRFRIAEVAAYNSGWDLDVHADGITLRAPIIKSLTERLAAYLRAKRPCWFGKKNSLIKGAKNTV